MGGQGDRGTRGQGDRGTGGQGDKGTGRAGDGNSTFSTTQKVPDSGLRTQHSGLSTQHSSSPVAIGFGSNQGDRLAHLEQAREALCADVKISACSPVYETPPWGVVNQAPFLNAVCLGATALAPEALLRALKTIEQRLGRVPGPRWGPRVVDLDLLLYGDLLLDTPTLTLPHPRLHERAFVLVPLADLAPQLRHPRLGTTVEDLLHTLDHGEIRRTAFQWAA